MIKKPGIPSGNQPDSNPENIDEYDLYYGENAVIDPEPVIIKKPGPLSRRPSVSSSYPFFVIMIISMICTFTPYAFYADWLWVSHDSVFTQHQYWRLLTALFTHADAVHLLSNVPLLFFTGIFLYEYFGFILFPVLSVIIGMLANLFTVYFYPGDLKLIGISGMVYGMVSLWLVLYIYHDTDYTVSRRVLRSVAFALVMLFPTTYDPKTSYLVHAAGFLTGIVSAVFILPFVKVKKRGR